MRSSEVKFSAFPKIQTVFHISPPHPRWARNTPTFCESEDPPSLHIIRPKQLTAYPNMAQKIKVLIRKREKTANIIVSPFTQEKK